VAARIGDAATAPLPAARAAVANIALAAVETIVPRLDVAVVITSGYLGRDRPDLAGLRHTERRTLDGWAADSWQRE
jgi:hypothetical protein